MEKADIIVQVIQLLLEILGNVLFFNLVAMDSPSLHDNGLAHVFETYQSVERINHY